MSTFPFQIERYIVKQLACDADPETIAEDVQSQFLRDLSPEVVRTYDPDRDGDALTPDLRALYRETRREYVGAAEAEAERRYVAVAATEEVADGTVHCIEKEDTAIVLVADGDEYAALANRCTHQGGPLCEGDLSGDALECPWHGASFDVHTGEPTSPPAVEAVSTYDVRVRDGTIEVKL